MNIILIEIYFLFFRYLVRLCIQSQWREVVVDDWFPCQGEPPKPLFMHNKHGEELWMMLIEKAWAKVYGSYAMISGGDATWALRNLTGAPSYEIGTLFSLAPHQRRGGRALPVRLNILLWGGACCVYKTHTHSEKRVV